jgi:Uncharacterised nucleotidyltransferase
MDVPGTLSSRKLSAEFRLAVATSVWPQSHDHAQRIEATMSSPIDWELFVRVVRRHRIDGLAFQALTTANAPLPATTRAALEAAAARQANKSLVYAAETVRVCRLLQEAGIAVACLKGASLSMLAFGNLGLRHCRDIDLLVSPENVLRAHEVLTTAAYELEMPIGPHSLSQKKHWIAHRKHFEYKNGKGIPLELHWRLFDNPQLFAPEVEPASWMEVPIFGHSVVQTLAAPGLLLYLCVHGANHMWSRLKWLADVQALLRRAETKVLERLQADAQTEHCERAVAQTLALTQLLYGFPFPEFVKPADDATRALVQSAVHAMTSGGAALELDAIPFATSRVAVARYRLKPEWKFWLRETNSILSDEHDRKSVHLPHSMRFLLPLLRLPLWIGRRIRGRGHSHRGTIDAG